MIGSSTLSINNNNSGSFNSPSYTNSNNSNSLNSSNNANSNISQLSFNLINLSTTTQQFDTIRKWLTKNHKKYCENDPPANKNLLQFLCQLIQFQEDNLGKNAPKPLPAVTRLPVITFILN